MPQSPHARNLNRLTTICLAAALSLTGCATTPTTTSTTQTASPETETTVSEPTPTPSASSSAKYKAASAEGPAENVPIPQMPAVAKEHTEEGFKAFVDYYFDIVNYSIATRSTDVLAPLAKTSCQMCNRFLETPEYMAKNDYWATGGEIHSRLTYSSMRTNQHGNIFGEAKLVQKPHKYYKAPRKVSSTGDGTESATWEMTLTPTDGGWIIADMAWPEPY